MSYAETLREHARIAILRFLEDAPRYTSNLSMLTAQLPDVGISYTRDQVRGELGWLQEQGLVTLDERSPSLLLAVATQRGVEVAQGIVRYPGIQRPGPGA